MRIAVIICFFAFQFSGCASSRELSACEEVEKFARLLDRMGYEPETMQHRRELEESHDSALGECEKEKASSEESELLSILA